MASKTKMQTVIDAAVSDASSMILKSTIAGLDRDTTVLELVNGIKGTQLAESFHEMTLAELAAAISGGASAPARRPGPPSKKAPTAKKGKSSRKLNTRTAEGRAELDAMIAEILKASSEGMRSEAINAQVPADTHQIRQSLNRLIAEGKASKTGEKRATTYSWGGAVKPKAARKKKARGRKKAAASGK